MGFHGNYPAQLRIEAARAWGVRPSEFDTWSDEDQAEACGWLDYERSLCDGCRQKRDEGRDKWRAWSVEQDDVCQGCRALAIVQQRFEKEAEESKNPLHNAGRRLYIARSRKIPNPLA